MNRVCLRHGFSLIELMIVVAIGSVVILGIMATMDYQNRVSKSGELNRQVDDIKRQIQTWISTQSICDLTFGGKKQGEPILGLMTKEEGGADDYLIKTGDRFPASNWTIQKMELLNSTEIKAMYPKFPAQVNTDGVGMAVLHVTLALLSGTSGSTLMTSAQDRGAFTTLEKNIYFPITAVFALIEPVPVMNCNNDLDPNNVSGACCLTCTMPSTGKTWKQYIEENNGGFAIDSTNPASFSSSYSKGEKYPPPNGPSCWTELQGGVPVTVGNCYPANINLPILVCRSAVVDPMSPYK